MEDVFHIVVSDRIHHFRPYFQVSLNDFDIVLYISHTFRSNNNIKQDNVLPLGDQLMRQPDADETHASSNQY